MMDTGYWLVEATQEKEFFSECERFVNNQSLFDNFKQNEAFCKIIGNDIRNRESADMWYKNLTKNKEIYNKINSFKSNDKYGSPILYNYSDIGEISPGTLYFISVLSDIIDHFGDIHNFNVVEIGSGYGGQAKIILDWGVKSYTCIDVSPTLNLCKKYLGLFDYKNIEFCVPENIKEREYNLVISNWCFSEFDLRGEKFYIEKIIKECDCGYFLMNIWDDHRKDEILNLMKLYFTFVNAIPDHLTSNGDKNWLLLIKK